ncbi:hypothetical protein HYC85_009059 [Camellia sinensis]|uniref:NB-ARC domain-containing protein n=1 Tax=Camellia sinensis TaxID=4442 RepID=A0A7J7HTQ0_CAMSI|nr:hypothetical protein HYC85_009059 [Camellia sinensis]
MQLAGISPPPRPNPSAGAHSQPSCSPAARLSEDLPLRPPWMYLSIPTDGANCGGSKLDLRVLAVFNPTFKSLPRSLSDMNNLDVLVLRGCHFLQKIDSILELRTLTTLKISGSNILEKIEDDFFKPMPRLQGLNLFRLQIESLHSSVYDLRELRWLILRGCSRLRKLDSLRCLRNLVVLDLYGATSLQHIQDESLSKNMELQILNLSNSNVGNISQIGPKLTHLIISGCQNVTRVPECRETPSLQIFDLSGSNYGLYRPYRRFRFRMEREPTGISKLINLRHHLLKNFTALTHVPLNSLSKLEELDLSSFSTLANLQDNSFENMSHLQRLDLSGTKIKSLPNLSSLCNLCHLLLAIPPLGSLSKLEELKLSGIRYLQKTGAGFLVHMSHLQILDLSKTMLEQLPSLPNLKNLHELYLRGCLGLKIVQDLEELTKLKVLDLSGTSVSHLPPLKKFSNLRQLVLRDCSCLEEFLQLELLDLLGGTVKELPYGISELTHLERLDLPDKKDSQGAESRNIQGVKELSLYDWGISSLSTETVGDNKRPPVLVHSAQLLQLLEKNHSLWDTSFKKFHFSICSIEEQNRKGGLYFHGDYFISRDIYVRTRYLTNFEEQRSLEISGFDQFPNGVDEVLSHADYIFLIDNTFTRWIFDLGASNLGAMKGYWIEKCIKTESIFLGDEEKETANLGNTSEELPELKTIGCAFPCLETLEIKECPMLEKVFSSSRPPEKLRTLQIISYYKLKSV